MPVKINAYHYTCNKDALITITDSTTHKILQVIKYKHQPDGIYFEIVDNKFVLYVNNADYVISPGPGDTIDTLQNAFNEFMTRQQKHQKCIFTKDYKYIDSIPYVSSYYRKYKSVVYKGEDAYMLKSYDDDELIVNIQFGKFKNLTDSLSVTKIKVLDPSLRDAVCIEYIGTNYVPTTFISPIGVNADELYHSLWQNILLYQTRINTN